MPRLARAVIPGLPHHVTQRGVQRRDVFSSEEVLDRSLTRRPPGRPRKKRRNEWLSPEKGCPRKSDATTAIRRSASRASYGAGIICDCPPKRADEEDGKAKRKGGR